MDIMIQSDEELVPVLKQIRHQYLKESDVFVVQGKIATQQESKNMERATKFCVSCPGHLHLC